VNRAAHAGILAGGNIEATDHDIRIAELHGRILLWSDRSRERLLYGAVLRKKVGAQGNKNDECNTKPHSEELV